MSTQVQPTEKFAAASPSAQGKAKSEDAVTASLEQLSELLELILLDEKTQESATRQSATPEESALQLAQNKMVTIKGYLHRLGPFLLHYMSNDPQKAQESIASLSSLLNEYAKGNQESLQKALEMLKPVIIKYLAENPGSEMKLLQIFAPLIRDAGGDTVTAHFVRAQKNLLKLTVALNGPNGSEVSKEIQSTMAQLFNTKADLANSLIDDLLPQLHKLNDKDPSKMSHFLNQLIPLVSMYAARTPEKVKELDLEKLYGLSDDEMDEVFNQKKLEAYQAPGDKDNPSFNSLMGSAMFFLQMFQQSVTKSQANQDKLQIQIGSIMMSAAQLAQKNVIEKVKEAEEKKAHHPWWEVFVEVVVCVVAAVASFLTMGLGAGLMAVAVGAFMLSGGFDKCVDAIATKIASDLYNKYYNEYIAEGKSPDEAKQLAEEKSQAVGNIIGKLVMMVALVIMTCGVGGLTVGTEAGAEEGIEEGAQEAVEQGADQSANNGVSWSSKGVGYLAASQGLQTLATSNVWMDCFMTNPEWANQHKTLVMVLDMIAVLVTALLSMGAMKGAFTEKQANGLLNNLGDLARYTGPIIMGSIGVQAAGASVEATMAGLRASYLDQLAKDYEEIGQLQRALQELLGSVNMMSFTTKINDDSASGITKTAGEEMAALEKSSGVVWGKADKVLRKTS